MNNFLRVKRNHRATPLRLVARVTSIMILVFLWPARGGAQDATPTDLNVGNISGKLTLTYKQNSESETDYAWYYKAGESDEAKFSGKLTGTNNNWSHDVIDIKSEKNLSEGETCPTLQLDGVNLTSTGTGSLFNMVENTKPLRIQATDKSASTLKSSGYVIKNSNGGHLYLGGGTAGLTIIGEGDKSAAIYLNASTNTSSITLEGQIAVTAKHMAVYMNNLVYLSAAAGAHVTVSSETETGNAIYTTSFADVKSPFLQWKFDTAPANGQTLEVKNANGQPFTSAISFTINGAKKGFAVNVAKDTGYTLWQGDQQLMDSKGMTVFTATEDKLFSFSGMTTLPTDWPGYARIADVGADGADVAVSGTSYTVRTARGLAWIAWVTNNGKTSATTGETHSASYPASAGFKDCTVSLAGDISLAEPAPAPTSGFTASWTPIGTKDNGFQGTFDGNGHTVRGMTIASVAGPYVGLFGYLKGATVKRLTMGESNAINLTTSTTINNYYLGSIAGKIEGGKIIDCHNRCAVTFAISDANKRGDTGGIVGTVAGNSVISACSNTGAVTVNNGYGGYVGGIAANSQNGTVASIVSCFNTGAISVTGTDLARAGGIMGDSNGNPFTIRNCYSTGAITATSSQSTSSGGIAGTAESTVVESCFATGTVSATGNGNNNSAAAGGIVGWVSGEGVQIRNCLALTTGGVKALGNTSSKEAGRIVGSKSTNSNLTLTNNHASTKIQLTKGENTSFPTTDIAADQINGADTYLDDVAAVIAAWAGTGNAFTAIGTADGGKLPMLKAATGYDAAGLPVAYAEEKFIPGQPESLTSATYLDAIASLSLSSATAYTLSCSDGKWYYQAEEDGPLVRFNGTVKMSEGTSDFIGRFVVSSATGNPTLVLEDVAIKPTGASALTIAAGCTLTLQTAGTHTSTFSSFGASTIVNAGTVTLTGNGLYIGNIENSGTYYGLDNSGSFTVADPTETEVTFHCDNAAIHNTGTLGNTWMEWQFVAAPAQGTDGSIAFAATDEADQSPAGRLRQRKTYATTVAAGKEYRLWMGASDSRALQQGKMASGSSVVSFPSPTGNGLAVFTGVKDAIPVTVTQPTDGGGTISVFSGGSSVATGSFIPNLVELTLKSYPLPGYELESFTINGSADNTVNTNSANKYVVPDDAIAVTVTASFRAKAVAPSDTTQTAVVGTVGDLPATPVEKPTAVIDRNNTTASNTGSEVKLVTGALEEEHKTSVKATLAQAAPGIGNNIIYAEIALVEIKTVTGGSGGTQTTVTPVQPTDGNTVHVVYPYPAGTDSHDSFVIVHLKTDGTQEVYRDAPDVSKGEKELQKTVRGLEFEVGSFSPFGIAWKKYTAPEPDDPYVPPYIPNYYTVTLPDVEGVTFSRKAGAYTVEEGYSFSFRLTLQDGYELYSKPVVRTSQGEVLEPRASDGRYVVRDVGEDIEVTVEGIVRNDDQPTANTVIASGTRVWAADGRLHLLLDGPARVCIVDMGGRVCRLFDASAGETACALRPGLYVVRLEGKGVFKVVVR